MTNSRRRVDMSKLSDFLPQRRSRSWVDRETTQWDCLWAATGRLIEFFFPSPDIDSNQRVVLTVNIVLIYSFLGLISSSPVVLFSSTTNPNTTSIIPEMADAPNNDNNSPHEEPTDHGYRPLKHLDESLFSNNGDFASSFMQPRGSASRLHNRRKLPRCYL